MDNKCENPNCSCDGKCKVCKCKIEANKKNNLAKGNNEGIKSEYAKIS